MQYFKPKPSIEFTPSQNDLLKHIPKSKLKKARKKLIRQIKTRMSEGYDKAKLRTYGLWDNEASRKGSLVVTRIEKGPRDASLQYTNYSQRPRVSFPE